MISKFSNAKMIKLAEEIFNAVLESSPIEKCLVRFPAKYLHNNRHNQFKVWNTMIERYFRAGLSDGAVELLERMLV